MYFRRYYSRFNSQDPIMRIIIIAAVVLVVAIFLPNLPGTGAGVDCVSLGAPTVNGSNQSIIASRVDPSVLRMDLQADKLQIGANESLFLNVRFYNTSLAPLTLFLVPDEAVLRNSNENGLVFSVRDINGTSLGESIGVRPLIPTRSTYSPTELHSLGPRGTCFVRLEFQPVRLRQARINQGNYRIAAVYRNTVGGAVPPVAANTPTPIFGDQGVWKGLVQSQEIIITVGQ